MRRGAARPRGIPRLLAAALALPLLLAACGDTDPADGAAPPGASPSPAATDAPAAGTPVIDENFPDPDTLLVDGTYYAYATQPAYGGRNVQVATSTDLESWELLAEDPLPRLPAWATTGRTWAPEVTALDPGNGFVMYFTARSVEPDLQCIGVATATAPLGPFEPAGEEPLVCPEEEGGAIDAASFLDEDGTRYLLWKNDGNCCGLDTWLFLQELSPDGLDLLGEARRLLRQDQPWEGALVEAPTLVRRGDTYVLLYSANSYGGEDYAVGYATASRLEGPYDKAPEPLLSTEGTGGTYVGPGGQDVLTDAGGRDHLVFHDWDPAVIYRGMHIADLTWEGGRPVVDLPAG